MINYKYLTKQIIVSDNGTLIYCASLYLLIYIIIYIYLVGKARDVSLTDTTAKTSLVLRSFHTLLFMVSNNIKMNSPHLNIKYGLCRSFLPKVCRAYHIRTSIIHVICLMQDIIPTKTTKSNGFKDGSINTLYKWSKWEKTRI